MFIEPPSLVKHCRGGAIGTASNIALAHRLLCSCPAIWGRDRDGGYLAQLFSSVACEGLRSKRKHEAATANLPIIWSSSPWSGCKVGLQLDGGKALGLCHSQVWRSVGDGRVGVAGGRAVSPQVEIDWGLSATALYESKYASCEVRSRYFWSANARVVFNATAGMERHTAEQADFGVLFQDSSLTLRRYSTTVRYGWYRTLIYHASANQYQPYFRACTYTKTSKGHLQGRRPIRQSGVEIGPSPEAKKGSNSEMWKAGLLLSSLLWRVWRVWQAGWPLDQRRPPFTA